KYSRASLHYRPGEAAAVARALIANQSPTAEVGGVAPEALTAARQALGTGGRVVVVLGRPSLAESAESVVEAAGVLAGLPNVSFLPALRRANVMGALDMGLAPGVLPGRVSLEAGNAWFREAWGAVAEERGMDATGILQAAAAGKIQALVLLGADPLSDFPDRQLAREGLAGAGTIVAVDTFLTDSNRQADVVLAAATYAERPGTTTNIEGRVTRLGQKLVPPGVAWPDWMIAAELAHRLGGDLGVETLEEIRSEIERLAPSHAGITDAVLADRHHKDGVVAPYAGGEGIEGRYGEAAHATGAGSTTDVPGELDPMSTPGVGAVEQQGVPATDVVVHEHDEA